MTAPERNLPPDSQAWGRYIEKRIAELSKAAGLASTTARAATARTGGAARAVAEATERAAQLEQSQTDLVQEVIDKDESAWAPVEPEAPQHNHHWYDVADGNVLKIRADYGEYERINYVLNPSFRHNTDGWSALGGSLTRTWNDKGLLTAEETGAAAIVETQGRAVTIDLPETPDDEDGEGGSPTEPVGVLWTASAELELVESSMYVTATLEVIDSNDEPVSTSGPVRLEYGVPTRITARPLESIEGTMDTVRVALSLVNEEEPEFEVTVDDVILEAADYGDDEEQQYFDGSMPGVLWQGDDSAATSWWDGEPRWIEAQDNKLKQELYGELEGLDADLTDLHETVLPNLRDRLDDAFLAVGEVDTKADQAVSDASAAQTAAQAAQTAAQAAQTTAADAEQAALDAAGIAEGKGQVITQSSAPTGDLARSENLWVRLPDHKVHIYEDGQWVAATDPDLVAAAGEAATARQEAQAAEQAAQAAAQEAQAAQSAAGTAQQTADAAMTAAGTKTTVTYSTSPPAGVGQTEGDTHRQRDSSGNIDAEWSWDGNAWQPQQITSEQVSNLDVGKLTAGVGEIAEVVSQRIAAAVAEFLEVRVGQIIGDEAGFDTAVVNQLWADMFAARSITAEEADLGSIAADEGFVQQLLAHNVDVAGHLRLAGSLYAQQGTYGLELTAEGIEMSSQGLTYLGDRWFLPDYTLSYSALGAYIVASHDDPTRPPAPWSNYLALYDATSGQEVRQIRSGGGLAFAQYHCVDPATGWIWVSRIEPDGDGGWQPVDMAAYDVMGTLVKTVPITAGIDSFAANDTYVVVDGGGASQHAARMVYDHSGTLLWEVPYGEPRYDPTPLAVVGHTLYDLRDGITSWDIPAQQSLGTIPLPAGGGHGTNVVGTDLLIPATAWPTLANYLTVYDTDAGQITANMQIDLGGNKKMRGATRVGGSYYVATDQEGLLATEQVTPFQNQQTQAMIDTITGGVTFNNPILRGVTKTEVTTADHLMASTRDHIMVRDRMVSQYGPNWFADEAERDALLPHAWAGTEAITYSPVTTVWRMGRNQQWVRVWSENSGHPYAQAAMSATITGTGSATATVDVPLPAGRFTLPPIIAPSSSNSNYLIFGVPTQTTATSARIGARIITQSAFTGDVPVTFTAIQMTPTSAEG